MADLATLKSTIASELHRTDLTTQIASAITQAINKYRSRRFEFNERQSTFNTVAQQQSYTTSTIPTDVGEVDLVRVTVNGRYVYPDDIGFEELQNLTSTTSSYGQPLKWAWYAQTMFFYPIPDAIYTVQLSYKQRKAAPANDADGTTIWTNQCEPLIRACAKKIVARDFMQDDALYQRCADAESEALNILIDESLQLQGEGGLAAND